MIGIKYLLDQMKKDKKEKNVKRLSLCILSSLVMIIVWYLLLSVKLPQVAIEITTILILIASILAFTLFKASLLNIVMKIIGKKSSYQSALTTLAYSLFIIVAGTLIATLISLIPVIGVFIAALIFSFITILAITVKLKVAMELFEVDLLTVIVGFLITGIAIMGSFYSLLLPQFGTVLSSTIPVLPVY